MISADLTFEQYIALPGLNWSTLRHMELPARYRWRLDHPDSEETTGAMRLGSAAHMLLLEPERFEATYTVEPAAFKGQRKSGTGDRAKFRASAEAAGLEVLSAEEYQAALGMAEAQRSRKARQSTAHRCMQGPGQNELTLTWQRPGGYGDRDCKARLDRVTVAKNGGALIIDVKTTQDAGRTAFEREIFRRQYHAQAAWYWDGWERANPTGDPPEGFAFLAIEKEPPYAAAFYPLSFDVIEAGRRHCSTLLAMLERCERADIWPGYESDEIELPKYYRGMPMPLWAMGQRFEEERKVQGE